MIFEIGHIYDIYNDTQLMDLIHSELCSVTLAYSMVWMRVDNNITGLQTTKGHIYSPCTFHTLKLIEQM